MNRFAAVLVMIAAFATTANAITVDLTLPNLTFPEPTETTQACIQPAQIGTPTCSATE